jgi:glycosyltransferase involved in cell wall biosynthesis
VGRKPVLPYARPRESERPNLTASPTPAVTVITVCLNSAKTIQRTIDSVLHQSFTDIEYIIVDGGSTDGTLDIIKRHRSHIRHLISEPDRGLYDAMNKGIGLSSGKWIHLLNADDRYADNDVLERALPHLVSGRTNYFTMFREKDGVVTDEFRYPYKHWRMFISSKLPQPATIVGREQYREIGLYDTGLRIAADHDFMLRMVKRYKPNFVDFPLVYMDQSGLSATNLELTYREFMEVTVRHGMPRSLAWGIYWIKRVRWGVY